MIRRTLLGLLGLCVAYAIVAQAAGMLAAPISLPIDQKPTSARGVFQLQGYLESAIADEATVMVGTRPLKFTDPADVKAARDIVDAAAAGKDARASWEETLATERELYGSGSEGEDFQNIQRGHGTNAYHDDVRAREFGIREWFDQRDATLGVGAFLLLLLVVLSLPWRRWLGAGAEVVGDTVGRTVGAARSALEGDNPRPIMGREKLAGYSVADEMLKWKRLLDEGVVTKPEYEAARIRLIGEQASQAATQRPA